MRHFSLPILYICVTTLVGCAKSSLEANSGMPITLSPVFQSAARATPTAFEAGDQIGLYVLRSVENAKFTASADGLIAASPSIYYPDPKQPVTLRAYYPYNNSVTDATKIPFTVTEDLKKSDLCYAQAEALPSKEAQTLKFSHLLSRVVLDITTNSKIKSVTSVKFINTATDLTINIETGAITLGVPNKSLAVNNFEVIVPPQTFAAGEKMLEITVETKAGTTEVYHYTPSSATTLEQGKSHSFSLSLADNKTVILNGSPQISPWTEGVKSGAVRSPVDNHLIVHWTPAHSRVSEINKIELTLKDSLTNITSTVVINDLVYNDLSFSFDLRAVDNLHYPYTVMSMKFYKNAELIKQTSTFFANSVYQSGTHSLGITAPENAVYINGLWWATGNLVATNTAAPNTAGVGGARIGAPTDGGLYFKFGSLVGLKGGAVGSGVGVAVSTHDKGYWLRPTGHTTSTDWASAAYFSDESKTSGDLRDYVTTDNAGGNGIGDACRYYLGAPWRLPTGREYGDLCNKQYAIGTNIGWAATGGKEVRAPAYGGWWNGTSSSTTDPANAAYFVGAGYRYSFDGTLTEIGTQGIYWSSSVSSATRGLDLSFGVDKMYPQHTPVRTNGFPVRCVQGIHIGLEPGTFSPVASSAHTIKLRLTGGSGDSWALAKSGAGAAAFTPNRTSGVFGANSVIEVAVATRAC